MCGSICCMYMYCMRSDSELGSEYVSGAVSESPVIVELSVAYDTCTAQGITTANFYTCGVMHLL